MATAAQRLSDALIRHQIDIERLKKGTATKFVKLLRSADAGMVAELRSRLDSYGETGAAAARKVKSLERLIDAVVQSRRTLWTGIRADAQKELKEIAQMESAVAQDLFEEAVGLEEFELPVLAAALFLPATRDSVWLGRTTAAHLKYLEIQERTIIERSIRQGVFEGLKGDEIIAQIRGTRGFGMTDGELQQTRNGLAAVMATAVLNAATIGQRLTWAESGVITGLVWTAVLDGRTSAICRSRDGHGVPLTDNFPKDIPRLSPSNARPPAHYNCRSYMEPTLRDVGIVKPHRMTVTDTRTEKARVRDFRAEAKKRAGAGWSGLTERQRRRRIRTVANEWAAANIGTVAPSTTYADFFSRQSRTFQRSVLGPSRLKLYEEGGLSLEKFVDFAGKPLNLEQLKTRYPKAFVRAGL